MNTDCAYRIGKTHSVCQDYVISREGEHPYVILADGCSSSPDTDVGARLLAHSAASALKQWSFPEQSVERLAWSMEGETLSAAGAAGEEGQGFHQELNGWVEEYLTEVQRSAITTASQQAVSLQLAAECLDATLLMIRTGKSAWLASISGDGVLVVKRRDGSLHVKSISYCESYPHYLNYSIDPGRRESFVRRKNNLRKLEHIILHPNGRMDAREPVVEPGDTFPYYDYGKIETCEWIAVLSDGVHSFTETVSTETSRVQQPVPFHTILRELLAFKNTSGVFAQRRMQKFLQECGNHNWQHRDDLSMGVISMMADR